MCFLLFFPWLFPTFRPFPRRTFRPGGQKLCRRLEVLIKSLCLNPAKYIFCGKWTVKSQCEAHCLFHLVQTRPEAASPKEMTIKRRPAVMWWRTVVPGRALTQRPPYYCRSDLHPVCSFMSAPRGFLLLSLFCLMLNRLFTFDVKAAKPDDWSRREIVMRPKRADTQQCWKKRTCRNESGKGADKRSFVFSSP